jgi:hypothetical protein
MAASAGCYFLGGQLFLVLVVLPVPRQQVAEVERVRIVAQTGRRFAFLSTVALTVLVAVRRQPAADFGDRRPGRLAGDIAMTNIRSCLQAAIASSMTRSRQYLGSGEVEQANERIIARRRLCPIAKPRRNPQMQHDRSQAPSRQLM